MQLGASPHVIRRYIVCLSPQSHRLYMCMKELPNVYHGPTSSFLHSQPIHNPPSGPGPSVPLAKCSFGMIPLSPCHAIQLIVHRGCSTPLPTMWYENIVLIAFVESRKLFPDGSMCLGGRSLAMEWMSVINFCDLRYWQPFCVCGEALSPPVHTCTVLG